MQVDPHYNEGPIQAVKRMHMVIAPPRPHLHSRTVAAEQTVSERKAGGVRQLAARMAGLLPGASSGLNMKSDMAATT